MVSARSRTNTRWEASNGVWAAAATTDWATSRRSISCAPLGATHVRSGCVPCSTRVRAPAGSALPRASSSAANPRAAARLPVPAGPCSRYAWARWPASAPSSTARAWGWASSSSTCEDPREVSRGRLITVEGLDGAGKTTLVGRLAAALDGRGRPVFVLREPGGIEVSERIRALLLDPSLNIAARAEALLFAAARAQLVEEQLRPLLERGDWVLLDRFVDSSLAYQGAGRGLGVDGVRALNEFGTGGLVPDRTLLLRIAPEVGLARLAGGADADRLEREQAGFFSQIAGAYDALAAAEPDRIAVIDASRQPDAVLADALAAV